MAGTGAGLMSASPQRPAQPVGAITDRLSEQGSDHQEGVGEHGKGDPAVPGAPAADLVLVQATQALAGLERLFDGPAPSGDPDQDGQRGGAGRVAAVIGQLTGLAVAADHEPVPACLLARSGAGVVQAEERPVVVAVAFGALAARD